MAKGGSPGRAESKLWRRGAKASRKLEAAALLEKEIESKKEVERERDRDRGILGLRRGKATGARSWLRIDTLGQCEALEADKYAIMRRCAIPARDLRILDPLLSYPSTLLGREKAIVVNLEHIKCIIMAEEVLVLNTHNPLVTKVVEEFKTRLLASQATLTDAPVPLQPMKPADAAGAVTAATAAATASIALPPGKPPEAARRNPTAQLPSLTSLLPSPRPPLPPSTAARAASAAAAAARGGGGVSAGAEGGAGVTAAPGTAVGAAVGAPAAVGGGAGAVPVGMLTTALVFSQQQPQQAAVQVSLQSAGSEGTAAAAAAAVKAGTRVAAASASLPPPPPPSTSLLAAGKSTKALPTPLVLPSASASQSNAKQPGVTAATGDTVTSTSGAKQAVAVRAGGMKSSAAGVGAGATTATSAGMQAAHQVSFEESAVAEARVGVTGAGGVDAVGASAAATSALPPTNQMPGPTALPFEFRALEVCLEAACGFLEGETTKLESEAYPALDELTASVSTLNLERVREIKSRLVVVSGRVQKVRDELEQLLDDDEDMDEMYLTDKLQQTEMHEQEQQLVQQQSDSFMRGRARGMGSGKSTGGEIEEEEDESVDEHLSQSSGRTGSEFTFRATGRKSNGAQRAARLSLYRAAQVQGQMDDRSGHHYPSATTPLSSSTLPGTPYAPSPFLISPSFRHSSSSSHSRPPLFPPPMLSVSSIAGAPASSLLGVDLLSEGASRRDGSHSSVSRRSSRSSGSSRSSKKWDVEELEMLLEAYFVQIEGTLNKLSSLREYVDDTEDYINIMLDEKQNSLLQMNVLLTTGTLFISLVIVITGVFGMNIPTSVFDHEDPANYVVFYYVVCGSSAIAIVLFAATIAYLRSRGLIVSSM